MSGRRDLSAALIQIRSTLPGKFKCFIVVVQPTILTFTFAVAVARISGGEEFA